MTLAEAWDNDFDVRIPDPNEPTREPDGVNGQFMFWLGDDGEIADEDFDVFNEGDIERA